WVEIGPYTEDKLIDSYNNGPEFDSRLLNGIPSDLPTDELEDPELQDVPIFGDDEKSGLQMAVQTELENNNAYGALKLVLQQGSSLQSVGNMPAYTLPSFFPTEYNGYRFVVPQNNVVLDFGQMFRDNMQFKGAWDVLRAIFGLLLFAGVVVFIVWDALKLLKD
ncbi:MAG: hypothetical protein J6X44_00760, partial [Thermoguttaceae bacterium]|nr:hypothetical protein [Thermoguttaceae bacterium]